jgi:hypothetical protein
VAHGPQMAEVLPPLYRQGELVAGVLNVPGVALDVVDEDLVAIQRSHWFDQAVELEHAAGLAAVLDLAPEPWQTLRIFRAWAHAFRDALLLEGSLSRQALTGFVRAYGDAFQTAEQALALPPLDDFADEPSTTRPALIENPARRREQRTPTTGGIEPLHQFELVNGGLDPATAGFLLKGLPEGRECVPVIANVTTGEALIYHGTIATGQRLWIAPGEDGNAQARLERTDVTSRLVSVAGLVPGTPWASVVTPARALTLRPGPNAMWFLPVAHFDDEGLDRFLLALADLELREGRYDETGFDGSLFYLDPAVTLHAVWTEAEPAAFAIELPAGTLRHPAGEEADARAARTQLETSLRSSIDRLRAAGVRAELTLHDLRETQRTGDALVAIQPIVRREIGPTGADAMPDAGGVFGVTGFDDSTYR